MSAVSGSPGTAGDAGAPPPTALDAARAVVDAVTTGSGALALVTVVESPEGASPAPGTRLVLHEDGAARGGWGDAALERAAVALGRKALEQRAALSETAETSGGRFLLYAEAQRPPDSLIVVGAGHIAVPLVRLGVLLGFRVTVLDDREEFATAERFPDAARVIRAEFSDPFRDVVPGPGSYVVLVTRGHRYDFDCLGQLLALERPPRYVGLIGSRRRVKAAFHALLESGVPRSRLERIRAPIGLDLGAETPEEIAVSIAAELVQVRRRGPDATAGTLTAREGVLRRLLPDAG